MILVIKRVTMTIGGGGSKFRDVTYGRPLRPYQMRPKSIYT